MKRFTLLLVLFAFIISCNKDDDNDVISTPALPPKVTHLTADYDDNFKSIEINWRYGSTSQISMFEVYYAPDGGSEFRPVDPSQKYFGINNVKENTSYLFNVRAVDLDGVRSESEVIYVDTK